VNDDQRDKSPAPKDKDHGEAGDGCSGRDQAPGQIGAVGDQRNRDVLEPPEEENNDDGQGRLACEGLHSREQEADVDEFLGDDPEEGPHESGIEGGGGGEIDDRHDRRDRRSVEGLSDERSNSHRGQHGEHVGRDPGKLSNGSLQARHAEEVDNGYALAARQEYESGETEHIRNRAVDRPPRGRIVPGGQRALEGKDAGCDSLSDKGKDEAARQEQEHRPPRSAKPRVPTGDG